LTIRYSYSGSDFDVVINLCTLVSQFPECENDSLSTGT
jgi:hypothetical protein